MMATGRVASDLWEAKHEHLLNFVDEAAGGKVLISSRVRGVLEGATVVAIGLPSEREAVGMLMAAAGCPPDEAAPAEARDVVRLCKCLPLSIAMAGKLVADLSLGGDWGGILEALNEEFEAGGQGRSMEESVIAASLRGIGGRHRTQTLALFRAMALLPEDVTAPLEVLAMIYEAEVSGGGGSDKRPTLLHVRRWLKQLVDRSLVLGTCDHPSLHDIPLDFVIGQHSVEELRGAHGRLVEILRASRPTLAIGGMRAWDNAENSPVSRYVRFEARAHIQQGMAVRTAAEAARAPLESALRWLGDVPQDDLVLEAGREVGAEVLEALAQRCAAEGRPWECARLYSLLSRTSGALTSVAALELGRKALDAIAEIDGAATLAMDWVELQMLTQVTMSCSPEDAHRAPRRARILATEASKWHPAESAVIVLTGDTLPSLFAADVPAIRTQMAKFRGILSAGASSHPDIGVRNKAKILIASWFGFEPGHSLQQTSFNWAVYHGDRGKHLRDAMAAYNYDVHHAWLLQVQSGLDGFICSATASGMLAQVWGDLVGAREWCEHAMGYLSRTLQGAAQQENEIFNQIWSVVAWAQYCHMMHRGDSLLGWLREAKLNWATLDVAVDRFVGNFGALFRKRGDRDEGFHVSSAEYLSWSCKLASVLVGSEVTAEEVMASLPTVDEMHAFASTGGYSMLGVGGIGAEINAFLLAGQACAKLGRHAEALPWLEVALSRDLAAHGTLNNRTHMWAGLARGQSLAALGRAGEAEAALEEVGRLAAEEGGGPPGYGLFAVLALRDAKRLVLDAAGRGAEAAARLAAAASDLLGSAPTAENRRELAVLLAKSPADR
jgi:hypothetical protein